VIAKDLFVSTSCASIRENPDTSRRFHPDVVAIPDGAATSLCVLVIGWLRSNSLNGGISSLGNVPFSDLMLILFGMPAFAAVVGWLLASREPAVLGRQPIE
jgi:hypothetical protein